MSMAFFGGRHWARGCARSACEHTKADAIEGGSSPFTSFRSITNLIDSMSTEVLYVSGPKRNWSGATKNLALRPINEEHTKLTQLKGFWRIGLIIFRMVQVVFFSPARTGSPMAGLTTVFFALLVLLVFAPCTTNTEGANTTVDPAAARLSSAGDTQPTHAIPPQADPASPSAASSSSPETPRINVYMADGQLVSWLASVFIEHDIPEDVSPQLQLLAGHTVTPRLACDEDKPMDGTNALHSGMRMLSGLTSYPRYLWKPVIRVWPVVTWTEAGPGGQPHTFTARRSRQVNLGNASVAWGRTFAIVTTLVAFLILLARAASPPIRLLCVGDGHLPLSKCQMAMSPLAVGAVVLFFAMLTLDVLEIPSSLIVLMGLSLVTTGVSAYYDSGGSASTQAEQTPPPNAAQQPRQILHPQLWQLETYGPYPGSVDIRNSKGSPFRGRR